jgi:deazaflavin-dependent oxidoreductase (nitroreductase family)
MTETDPTAGSRRYIAPGWFTTRVFNPTVAFLTRRGISLMGSRVLTVRGRTTGVPRSTVVNLLTLDDERFLVAPRGHTQWTKNLRAAPDAQLRVGRRVESITASELPDADKLPVLRAYLHRWRWEVGQFFEGIDEHSSDEALAAVAADFPVFRLQPA